MNFDLFTASICFLGWLLHWLLSWGVEWRKSKKRLVDYIDDNPPAFYISVVATVAVYLIGPSILPAVGVSLPIGLDDPAAKGVIAFLAGYSADSLVYKAAKLLPAREE